MKLLFYDFEVFRYDWLVCIGDMKERKMYTIVNNKQELEEFFDRNRESIWIGFNSRYYDQYILKTILCDIDPYMASKKMIDEKVSGYKISRLFNDIQFYNYDCKPKEFGLKKIEAFMGSDIKESDVPFDIQRKLTKDELEDVIKYCKHDVRETYKVFMHTVDKFNSQIAAINEFSLPKSYISKTDAQMTADLLGARKREFNDEFDLEFSDLLDLGKLEYIKERFVDWGKNIKDYTKFTYSTKINGIPHTYGFGGLHGAIPKYVNQGRFLLIDVASFYPALMIEHGLLSRTVTKKWRYIQFRDERIALKKTDKKRANIRKIPLNAAFGACKEKNSKLYDPRQANNICINGQMFLTDLLDKLIPIVQVIQSNTDGILVKIETEEQEKLVKEECTKWSKRTKFELDYEVFTNIVQRDVNNYIAWNMQNGELKKLKQKGFFKERTPIDNEMGVVIDAIINYFMYNVPVEKTIKDCNDLMKYMLVANIGDSYDYLLHNGKILKERIVRYFASKDKSDTCIFKHPKKYQNIYTINKLGIAKHCFIDNSNIVGKKVPDKLDKDWYVLYTKYQIAQILGEFEGLKIKDYKKLLTPTYDKGLGSNDPQLKNYNPRYYEDLFIRKMGKLINLK